MRWAGHVVHMTAMRNANKILVGSPEGKKRRRRGEVNNEVDLKELGWDVVNWIKWPRVGLSGGEFYIRY